MINIKINGADYQLEKVCTILEAATDLGFYIPTLCYLKDVSNIGSCRLCMVSVEGYDSLLPACRTKVWDGMSIVTESDLLTEYRRNMLKLILSNHDLDCMSCSSNGKCELQSLCNRYDVRGSEHVGNRAEIENRLPVMEGNPYISYEPGKCIHCQRCINMCHRVACNGTIKSGRLGTFHIVEAPFGENYKETGCESCGNCAAVCPTGALSLKRERTYREWEVKKVLTTCPHCATGCQFYLVVKDNRIVNVEAADGPSNHKRLCVKGRSGSFDFVHSPDRLKKPLIKDRSTGKFREAGWEEAIDYTAKRFMELREKFGGDSLAGFACSRSANEDIYMVQKMVRTCFGTNNTDNCARVCHSASVAGLAKTLGSGAMTNPVYDITHDVDVIMLVGSNPEEAHPVVGMQIREAVKRGTRLIVVDPRDIGLSKVADIHLKLRPGTNVAFANGMMNVMINEDLVDHGYIRDNSEGFEKIRELVSEYTPEKVGEICHIDPDMLREAARMYATAKKAPIIYCLGVTEHSTGTEGVMSMSDMAVLCGKIGRSGCGVNPLRGQNNVQGACDMGAMPTDFPGYQKVDNEDVRLKFEKAWGVKLNRTPGLKATEVFPAAIEGKIKGLYICGEDPIVSDPDTHHIIKALESLQFLVVQDLFMTKTAEYADVILPALSYAEKEGTFTNTERRVQRIRKAVELPGEMRADTDIIIDLMNAMGYKQPYLTPSEIMDEIAELTPSFHGISHSRLDSGESLQWPCPDKDKPGTDIMHKGHPVRGKALLYPAEFRDSDELPDEEYSFILMTGRILYHYNASAMTSRSKGLMDISGEGFIEINYRDADKLGIRNGSLVRVTSRRGSITAKARVGRKVSEGETWMPFHFPDSPVNMLTNAALDEFARIPEYKVCAVKVEACGI
ncbi:formate dehydrogenase subunit alpha [Oribacterium sp. WCC10]|uniref:formate dehydrogenase subunit alpha n=1 Tax=Oribacterium sp. WCC10 TaxID=1855343 RepID=UPI0008F3787D|nr:formate dehydrogenase subunit alpha [Oribacterium sp. WCC10]SFG63554.1 NAD-dependent formate dehydrogenase catalytic subunit [Oribacterium sp. WCC10]